MTNFSNYNELSAKLTREIDSSISSLENAKEFSRKGATLFGGQEKELQRVVDDLESLKVYLNKKLDYSRS